MIQLNQVSKTYQKNQQTITALDHINLHIKKGEICGILGESGAGKSTLLRCLNLLEQPCHGQVIIEGVDLATLSTQKLNQQRHNMGMIFQHFNLLSSRTAWDNVALPLELLGQSKNDIQKRVDHTLSLVNLTSRQHHYPHELSGGQKQRVGIARALTTNPRILLCDEATSALDPTARRSLLDLLKKLRQELQLTIVLITHELEVIKRICDHVVLIDQGAVVEQSSVIDFFSQPQSSLAKQLIHDSQAMELPPLIKQHPMKHGIPQSTKMVRLHFIGENSDQSIITHLIQQYHIDINILQANLETIQDTTMGFTLCQLSGSTESMRLAFEYLHSLNIRVEEVSHG